MSPGPGVEYNHMFMGDRDANYVIERSARLRRGTRPGLIA